MDITKADIEKRLAEIASEGERVIAQTIGTYEGARQENERWLRLILDDNKE